MDNKPTYIASCSFGKDSIATILLAYLHNEPLDRIFSVEVMFDNANGISGEIPEHIEWVHNFAVPYLRALFGGKVKIDIVKSKMDSVKAFTRRCTKSKEHPELWTLLENLYETHKHEIISNTFVYEKTFEQIRKEMDFIDRQTKLDFD